MLTFDYNQTPVNQVYKTSFKLDSEIVNTYMESIGMAAGINQIPFSIFATYHNWNSTIGKPVPGTIHLKQKMTYFIPPKINDIYEVLITITKKYQKKDRDYLVFETDFFKSEKLYCKSQTTYLWGYTNKN